MLETLSATGRECGSYPKWRSIVIKRQVIVEHITLKFNRFLGTSQALLVGLGIMVLWALSFRVADKWHEIIVEAVGMVSFLNLFTLQRSQNKDLKAIHIKLDELIASSSSASNRLIKAEEIPEHVLDQVHELYKDAAKNSNEDPARTSISVEAVEEVMDALHRDGIGTADLAIQITKTTENTLAN